eukprot:scaffold935_cov196-Alexandrium_tamarense.AAC.17
MVDGSPSCCNEKAFLRVIRENLTSIIMSDYDMSDNDLEDGNIDWEHSAIGDIEDLDEDLMMQESEYEDEQDCNAFFPKMTARTYRARIQHLKHDNTRFFCYNFADKLGEGDLRVWGCFLRAALVWIE